MSATLIGVTYNTTTKKVRVITIPELGDGFEDQHILDLQKQPPTGCAVATILQSAVANFRQATLIAALNSTQGLGLVQCGPAVLVDVSGNIVEHVIADAIHTPALGGHAVINNDVGAVIGDVWNGTKFQRKYVLFDRLTAVAASIVTLPLPQKPILTGTQDFVINQPATVGQPVPGVKPFVARTPP